MISNLAKHGIPSSKNSGTFVSLLWKKLLHASYRFCFSALAAWNIATGKWVSHRLHFCRADGGVNPNVFTPTNLILLLLLINGFSFGGTQSRRRSEVESDRGKIPGTSISCCRFCKWAAAFRADVGCFEFCFSGVVQGQGRKKKSVKRLNFLF